MFVWFVLSLLACLCFHYLRGAARECPQLRPQRRTVLDDVKLHHRVLRAKAVEQCLGLDAEGSGGEAEHQHGLGLDETVQLRLRGGSVGEHDLSGGFG